MAVGPGKGKVLILDSTTHILLREIEAQGGIVNALAFSPDGSRLATASRNQSACVWDVSSGDCFLRILVGGAWRSLCSVALSPDGRSILAGGEGGASRRFSTSEDIRVPKLDARLHDHAGFGGLPFRAGAHCGGDSRAVR